MQLVLLDHSFFRPSPAFSLCLTPSFLPLFCSLFVLCEFLLFLLCDCRLKDAEQQWNKGGSALIKYSNLLSSPFCCGGSTAKIDEALSETHETHYIYCTSQPECDGTPIKQQVCIRMSTFILKSLLVCLLIFTLIF